MSLLSSLVPSLTRTTAPATSSTAQETARDLGPTVKPVYDLVETADGFALTVHLPGVNHAGLEVRADSAAFTVTGRRTWKKPEGWTSLYRETDDSAYELVLTHDNVLDLDKVQAELRDGVLRVALAKTEAIKPRRIAVS
jgi:HSP20 family molecular chaperone IbpA